MPATFAHPIAVLPLWRWCPRWLNAPALVIGSMAPDMGYYLHRFALATVAHTWAGTWTVALPAGLLMLMLFYLLRPALNELLPQPHREALRPLAEARPAVNIRFILGALASLMIGIWTHTVWDAFTHPGAWFVVRLAWLREPLFTLGDTSFTGAYLLQQGSTLAGTLGLGFCYWRWLRGQHRPLVGADPLAKGVRPALLAALALASLAVALPAAWALASRFEGYLAVRVFVFRGTVRTLAAAVVFYTLAAVLVKLWLVTRKSRGNDHAAA